MELVSRIHQGGVLAGAAPEAQVPFLSHMGEAHWIHEPNPYPQNPGDSGVSALAVFAARWIAETKSSVVAEIQDHDLRWEGRMGHGHESPSFMTVGRDAG